MQTLENIKRPSKEEQIAAMKSYDALANVLNELKNKNPEIEIEETREKIRIPLNALKLLAQILKETSNGRPVSIVPIATELTTQATAELLGCSRPHVIKLLESGEIKDDLDIVPESPFITHKEGSLGRRIYREFTQPLSHQIGFVDNYETVFKLNLFVVVVHSFLIKNKRS